MRKAEPSTFGGWLRRRAVFLGLLGETAYRRNVLTILALDLKRLLGWAFFAATVAVSAGCFYFSWNFANSPAAAYEVIQTAFAFVAIGMGAGLYAREQQAGTFELLWLATGSERELLRARIIANLLAVGLLAIPAQAAMALTPAAAGMNHLAVWLLLLSNSFVILAAMAFLGTFSRHVWVSGLMGLVAIAAWYWALRGENSVLSLFINPFQRTAWGGTAAPTGSVVSNRILLMVFGLLLLGAAARRLRRVV